MQLLKVKISIEDDKGKRAEIELSEADNLSKLVNPIETTKEEIGNKSNEIKQKMIKGLTLEKEELENTYKETKDQPEYLTLPMPKGRGFLDD
jgi:hypothetical protein